MDSKVRTLLNGERKGPIAWLLRAGLRLASWPYCLAMRLRNLAFERGWKQIVRAEVPIISVGNLTVGGTGKTPCVEYLARWLRARDIRVTLLSRGYGAEEGRNDEARVLEQNLPDVPHLQGADRVELARTAIEELESELLLLDDGFQHRRLGRDLDLVLIDATCPWGYGAVLPRGLLREPISGLRRASLVLLTRCDQVDRAELAAIRARIHRIAPGLDAVETRHRPAGWINASGETRPSEEWKGRAVAGFCGLGNPEAFRRTLESLGATIAGWRTFPDHHGYTRADVEDLSRWAAELPDGVILATTQKDLVKLQIDRLGPRELWALRIELEVGEGKRLLHEKLEQTVGLLVKS